MLHHFQKLEFRKDVFFSLYSFCIWVMVSTRKNLFTDVLLPSNGEKIPPGGRQCFEATVQVEFAEMLRFFGP